MFLHMLYVHCILRYSDVIPVIPVIPVFSYTPMIVGTEVTRYVAFTITPICLKLCIRILEPLLLFIDDY